MYFVNKADACPLSSRRGAARHDAFNAFRWCCRSVGRSVGRSLARSFDRPFLRVFFRSFARWWYIVVLVLVVVLWNEDAERTKKREGCAGCERECESVYVLAFAITNMDASYTSLSPSRGGGEGGRGGTSRHLATFSIKENPSSSFSSHVHFLPTDWNLLNMFRQHLMNSSISRTSSCHRLLPNSPCTYIFCGNNSSLQGARVFREKSAVQVMSSLG